MIIFLAICLSLQNISDGHLHKKEQIYFLIQTGFIRKIYIQKLTDLLYIYSIFAA